MRMVRVLALGSVLVGVLTGVAPGSAACPPDGRTLDVPDGMAWNPGACEIFDPLIADAMAFASEQDIAPATAMTLLRAQQDLDATLGRIAVTNPETYAGFQWTWTHDTVTLVARFKGAVPPDVQETLAGIGIPVRYELVDRSLADLEALRMATAMAISAPDQVTAIDLGKGRVVASVSAAVLTPGHRARIAAFLREHPDVQIDTVDGPVFDDLVDEP